MSTTKAQIKRVTTEVDVFLTSARDLVSSFMPTGLGERWQKEHQELTAMIDKANRRFKLAIRDAQKQGWADK
jgi:hypothetical protein